LCAVFRIDPIEKAGIFDGIDADPIQRVPISTTQPSRPGDTERGRAGRGPLQSRPGSSSKVYVSIDPAAHRPIDNWDPVVLTSLYMGGRNAWRGK
jgi:hypothetical protein